MKEQLRGDIGNTYDDSSDPDSDQRAWRRALRANPPALIGFAFGVLAFLNLVEAASVASLGMSVDGPVTGSVMDRLPVAVALPLALIAVAAVFLVVPVAAFTGLLLSVIGLLHTRKGYRRFAVTGLVLTLPCVALYLVVAATWP